MVRWLAERNCGLTTDRQFETALASGILACGWCPVVRGFVVDRSICALDQSSTALLGRRWSLEMHRRDGSYNGSVLFNCISPIMSHELLPLPLPFTTIFFSWKHYCGMRPRSYSSRCATVYQFFFTARRVCIARTMPRQDVCPSVCLSVRLLVCLSHDGIVSKRLYISQKFF